jgi:hypothetical protein
MGTRWLEVWDYDFKERINAGYVTNDKPLFDQLCSFVSFEKWNEVRYCFPMQYRAQVPIYKVDFNTIDVNMNKAKQGLEVAHDYIFRSDNQLVLQMLKTPDNPYISNIRANVQSYES